MDQPTDSPRLLLLETATRVASVALSEGESLVARYDLHLDKSHARALMPMVKVVLEQAQWQPQDLQAVVVSGGPGSYTGLRVGVSSAKGLCFALDLPMIAISSLEALAQQALPLAQAIGASVVPMLDARRMEVYAARYRADGQLLDPVAPTIVDADTFLPWLEAGPVVFVGDGVEKCRELLGQHPNARLLPQQLSSAVGLHAPGLQRYRAAHFEDLEAYEPFYLKAVRVTKPKNPLRPSS